MRSEGFLVPQAARASLIIDLTLAILFTTCKHPQPGFPH